MKKIDIDFAIDDLPSPHWDETEFSLGFDSV